MVLPDGMVHFLKIKKFIKNKSTKTILWLSVVNVSASLPKSYLKNFSQNVVLEMLSLIIIIFLSSNVIFFLHVYSFIYSKKKCMFYFLLQRPYGGQTSRRSATSWFPASAAWSSWTTGRGWTGSSSSPVCDTPSPQTSRSSSSHSSRQRPV